MSASRRPKISNQLWEAQRTTIKRLYLDEKRTLEGKDGTITIMEREHGFSAGYVNLVLM